MLNEGLRRAQSGTSQQCSVNRAPAGGADGSNADKALAEINQMKARF